MWAWMIWVSALTFFPACGPSIVIKITRDQTSSRKRYSFTKSLFMAVYKLLNFIVMTCFRPIASKRKVYFVHSHSPRTNLSNMFERDHSEYNAFFDFVWRSQILTCGDIFYNRQNKTVYFQSKKRLCTIKNDASEKQKRAQQKCYPN